MISCRAFRWFDCNFVGAKEKILSVSLWIRLRFFRRLRLVSSSPPRFVETLKMLTTEPFFTTLLVREAQDVSKSFAEIDLNTIDNTVAADEVIDDLSDSSLRCEIQGVAEELRSR